MLRLLWAFFISTFAVGFLFFFVLLTLRLFFLISWVQLLLTCHLTSYARQHWAVDVSPPTLRWTAVPWDNLSVIQYKQSFKWSGSFYLIESHDIEYFQSYELLVMKIWARTEILWMKSNYCVYSGDMVIDTSRALSIEASYILIRVDTLFGDLDNEKKWLKFWKFSWNESRFF